MTSYTKKPSHGKKKDRNTLYLKRFKKDSPAWVKTKQNEVSIVNKHEMNGMFILQQMGIRRGKKSDSIKRSMEVFLELKKRFKHRDTHALVTELLMEYRTLIFLKSKKLGSVTYKIPISLFKKKGMRVVARWLMCTPKSQGLKDKEAAKQKLIDLLRKQSDVLKKRLELHKVGYNGIPYLTYVKREKLK